METEHRLRDVETLLQQVKDHKLKKRERSLKKKNRLAHIEKAVTCSLAKASYSLN